MAIDRHEVYMRELFIVETLNVGQEGGGRREKGQAFIVELSTSHRDCRLLSRHYVPTYATN